MNLIFFRSVWLLPGFQRSFWKKRVSTHLICATEQKRKAIKNLWKQTEREKRAQAISVQREENLGEL